MDQMTEQLSTQKSAAGTRTDREPVVRIEGVTKTYISKNQSVEALQRVDMDIHAGEFISFVGPSGCGKSTLLSIMSALLPATGGQVIFQGEPLTEPSRDIGIMFQSAVLLPWRTIEKNAILPSEVAGKDKESARTRVDELLNKVGLSDFKKAYPHQLSGGMQQRASLARVLSSQPKMLLMDEPFGALDEFTREAMNLELLRITEGTDMVVGFVTHNINEAVFLADRVVVMSPRPGRVAGIIEVDLPRPRTIESMHEQRFTDLAFEVRELLGGH